MPVRRSIMENIRRIARGFSFAPFSNTTTNAFNRCQGINLPNHIENSKLKLKCFKDTYFRPTLAVVEVSNNLFGWSTHIWPLTNVKSHTSLPGCDIARCCVEVDIPKITFQSQTLQHFVGSRKKKPMLMKCKQRIYFLLPNSFDSLNSKLFCLFKADAELLFAQSKYNTISDSKWNFTTRTMDNGNKIRKNWSCVPQIYLKKSSSHFPDPNFLNITGKEEYCTIVVFWKADGGGWVGD